MDNWEIIGDTYIWTEIDLNSNVRNYYVNRQVRAVFRWLYWHKQDLLRLDLDTFNYTSWIYTD